MILIYNDEGVSQLCIQSLQNKIKSLYKEYKIIDSDFIKKNELTSYTSFIMPGGADIPYCNKLNSSGIYKIQRFVKNGGTYLGICAGAYFACSELDFTGEGYCIKGTRELKLFEGIAIGSIPDLVNHSIYYNEKTNSKAIVDLEFKGIPCQAFYHGGPYFTNTKNHQILATYSKTNQVAIISDIYGKGRYILSGVHFEVDYDNYMQRINNNFDLQIMDEKQELHLANILKHSNQSCIWDFIISFL